MSKQVIAKYAIGKLACDQKNIPYDALLTKDKSIRSRKGSDHTRRWYIYEPRRERFWTMRKKNKQ